MAKTGWYNDETDPTLARWFDGVVWTEHVVVKADWEGFGQAPPPPPAPPEPEDTSSVRRIRTAVGSAVIVAALVVGGVALARDGGGHRPGRAPTGGQPYVSGGAGAEVGDGADPAVDATSVASTTGRSGSAVGTDASPAKSTTPRTTPGAAPSGTVRRTETSTHTHTDPTSQADVVGGDKSSIGNSTDTTIRTDYVPPPPTTTSSTVADTTPSTDTTDTTDGTSTPAPNG